MASSADLTVAAVAALRGDHARVAPALDRARRRRPGRDARLRRQGATGRRLNALAQGSHTSAHARLGQLFAADGTPLHQHFSYLAIADLAEAAVRADRRVEARALIQRALARVDPALGPRLEQLAARALALTAESAQTEEHFARAMASPAGRAWPFERAQLQLDYGEWLRRQRRINDAKPILTAALDTFRRLGAVPWTARAQGELRACGVPVKDRLVPPSALADLTAQQREIVRGCSARG
ncbi:MAG TPA: hypothetical protein VF070_08715 [Streptosporangiaceae bacterium]